MTTAAFGPDGTRYATGSLDRTIRLWDTETGWPLCVYRGHLGGLHAVAFGPLGDRILSAAEDGAALWNVARFATQPVQPIPLAARFTTVETVNAIHVTYSRRTEPAGVFLPAPPGYLPASFSPRQRWATVEVGKVTKDDRERLPRPIQERLSDAKTTRDIDARAAVTSPRLPGYESCGVSHDGRRKAYWSATDRRVIVCDANGNPLKVWALLPNGRPRSAVLSPSGRDLLVAKEVEPGPKRHRYEITVYDASTGGVKRVLRKDDDRQLDWIEVDPKETRLMVRAGPKTLVALNYETGERIGELDGIGLKTGYRPDGSLLATAKSPDHVVSLYDCATLAPRGTLPHLFWVRWFEFSPDGKHLIVGQRVGRDYERLTMWDVASARQIWSRCEYTGHSQGAFSPDGTRLLMHNRPNYSILLDARDGQVLCIVLVAESCGDLVFGDDGASLRLGAERTPRLAGRITAARGNHRGSIDENTPSETRSECRRKSLWLKPMRETGVEPARFSPLDPNPSSPALVDLVGILSYLILARRWGFLTQVFVAGALGCSGCRMKAL